MGWCSATKSSLLSLRAKHQNPSHLPSLQDAFDAEKCKKVLVSDGSKYRAGINVWSVDMLKLQIGVPLVSASIRKFREHYFTKPSLLPLDVVLCVGSADEAASLTKLKQIGPPEMLFAYIEAIAMDIVKGDDDLLMVWRKQCWPALHVL